MAAVASSASVATPGVRDKHVWAKDRINSAANPPVAVKRLSPQRSATQPLPSFNLDPTPIITEFYGPSSSKQEQKPTKVRIATPEAVVLRDSANSSR
jgi:hypothetical protein